MAAFIPYDNQRGYDKFEKLVMAGVCCDSAEYSRRLQLGEDASDLQKIAHSLQDASSAAVKAQNDQVAAKAIVDARKRQENEDFEQVVGLRNGRSVSADVDDLLVPDIDDDDVDDDGDDFDGLNDEPLMAVACQAARKTQDTRTPPHWVPSPQLVGTLPVAWRRGFCLSKDLPNLRLRIQMEIVGLALARVPRKPDTKTPRRGWTI
jgi:hypothetical protein